MEELHLMINDTEIGERKLYMVEKSELQSPTPCELEEESHQQKLLQQIRDSLNVISASLYLIENSLECNESSIQKYLTLIYQHLESLRNLLNH